MDPLSEQLHSDEPSFVEFTCPHCDHPVLAEPAEQPQELQCSACAGIVLIPASDGRTDIEQEQEEARLLRAPARPDEIDGLRVRNITVGRRALIRARTYALVAALGCLFAIVKAILSASELVAVRGWTLRPATYLAIALLATWGLVHFVRKLAHLSRELKRPPHPLEDLPPPDFTTLSDGSQHWKHLDEM